jgi:hypothetical protein
MRKIAFRLGLGLIALVFLMTVLSWVFLSAPLFAQMRTQIASNLLSDAAGYPLLVKNDARISLGPTTEVMIRGVELAGSENPDDALATLGRLEFDLNFLALLKGNFQPDEIVLDGLQIKLMTHSDGSTNWSVEPDSQDLVDGLAGPPEDVGDAPYVSQVGISLLRYLLKKNASFGSVGFNIDNQVTGFSFVFDLGHLYFVQDVGGGLEITGGGQVNKQPFDISADIPDTGPFYTRLNFGEVAVAVEGNIAPETQDSEFAGAFSLRIGEIGNLLEVLRLKPIIAGNAEINAHITFASEVLDVQRLDATVNLADGKQAKIEGSIANLMEAEGIDLSVSSRFHPPADSPKSTTKLKEMVLTAISAKIVGDISDLEFEDVHLRTNAFDVGLNDLGPVSISGVQRTPDGYLAFQEISIQSGQIDGAFLDAQGHIGNVLQLKDYGFEGQINIPASFVLKTLRPEEAQLFGGLKAQFTVDDSSGPITLRELQARSVDTVLWQLVANARINDLLDLQGTGIDFALDIADSARFMKALELRGVDTGSFHLSGYAKHNDSVKQLGIGLGAGSSRINANLKAVDKDGVAIVRGRVFSEKLELTDLSKALMAAIEIQKLAKSQEAKKTAKDIPEQDPDAYQPLLVEKTYQPLVLEKTYEPLILPPKNTELADFITLKKLLLETDLSVDIDIKKLSGQQGVSRISSKLIVDQGKARLGPLEIKYGGGFINLDAKMNLLSTPDLLSISGATGGWDFGKILTSVGVGIKANGKLDANFNLTGNRLSSKAFVNSMYGTASVKMKEGRIATSLLELAGLGIFPWLFSKELATGYTDIVCVSAPLRIDAGEVTMNPLVAETRKVQVVAAGKLDLRKDTIALIAEPRPVGRPWARTAWPIGISGKLSKPEFTLSPNVKLKQSANIGGKMPGNRIPCTPDARQLE